MANMKEDHVSTAAAELHASRLTDVLKAKALTAHRILMAAMDDVQSQFCGGMRQLSAPGLQDALAPDEISDLCTVAVVAVRQALDSSYTVPVLEAELTERIRPRRAEAAAADSAVRHARLDPTPARSVMMARAFGPHAPRSYAPCWIMARPHARTRRDPTPSCGWWHGPISTRTRSLRCLSHVQSSHGDAPHRARARSGWRRRAAMRACRRRRNRRLAFCAR